MEYTWKLIKLKRVTTSVVEDAVVQVYWELTGTDEDGNTGVFNGDISFDLSTVDLENFIPYQDLTEDLILGWVQAMVVGVYKEGLEKSIAHQIEQKKLIILEDDESSFPWNNE